MWVGGIGLGAMGSKLVNQPDSPPDSGDLERYVENRLFRDRIDSLEAHVDRKKAVSDTLRYSILYLLYEFEDLPRKQLVEATGKNSNGLQHHLRDLLDGNMIAEVPAPDDEDGRLTFYRITTLGRQEIEADIRNITGEQARLQKWQELPDPSDVNNLNEKSDVETTNEGITDTLTTHMSDSYSGNETGEVGS